MEASCSGPDAAVVAVFDDRVAAEGAVDALTRAGFAGDQIGYVIRGGDAVAGGTITDAAGTKDVKGALIGALEGGMIGGVLATVISIFVPPIGSVLVGGLLASFFGGTIAGSAVGGILGALRGLGISEEEARFYQRQFHEGRALVAVRAGARSAQAADVLAGFGGQHVHCEPHSPIETHGAFSTP